MAQVRIDPKAGLFPYLEAGKYGPGMDHEAECEIMEFSVGEDNPAYDPDGKQGPYAYLNIQVRQPDKAIVNIRHHESIAPNSGCRLMSTKAKPGWLANLGVEVADDGTFDDTTLPGKKCIVECGDPRVDKENPDRKFTRLRNVFGT